MRPKENIQTRSMRSKSGRGGKYKIRWVRAGTTEEGFPSRVGRWKNISLEEAKWKKSKK